MGFLKKFCLLGLWVVALPAAAFEVQDIEIEGLQRLPERVVYGVLPINVGDSATTRSVASAIDALFATGYFDDIQMFQVAEVLRIQLKERPSVSEVVLEGNQSVDSERLLAALSEVGVSENQVFKRASLARIALELKRQYTAQGRYNAEITTEITPKPRNRVAIKIVFVEGDVAVIERINLVGNQAFPSAELRDLMKLKTRHWAGFFKKNDRYAREKLAADLEVLRSFYLDRGYVNFAIESVQVAVSSEKDAVYISVHLNEGSIFQFGEFNLMGALEVGAGALTAEIQLESGATFSRAQLRQAEERLRVYLSNQGYLYGKVRGVTSVTETGVDVNFFVNAGQRVSVRRIGFRGNEQTRDEVLRREMRQMEAAPASSTKIERSRARLNQLGFFKGVEVKTEPVAGVSDQVDLVFEVEEQPSGSIGGSIGYQERAGLVFGANLSQNNFLGTGNRVSFDLQRTDLRNSYRFAFNDPYFTKDGISRGYNVYFTETDFSDVDLSRYRADAMGAAMSFGYPVSEEERLSFSFGLDQTEIFSGVDSPEEVKVFIGFQDVLGATQSEAFLSYVLSGSWTRNSLNHGIFATRGARQRVQLNVNLPGSDLKYYKLTYTGERYQPISDAWTWRVRTKMGVGAGYGGDTDLPFFKHFFAGGVRSVRGYDSHSLGPRDTSDTPDPFGGNLLSEISHEFIFPAPLVKDKRMVRTALFIDGGNVFDLQRGDAPGFGWDALRFSAGLSISWLTAVGPLSFTFAKAFNDEAGDEQRFFDFSFGQGF